VTDKIREKANSIVGDSKDPHEITRKLYEWVATNVHYAGNCVGLGAVVPHDTDFILENRIGDCKDHATLLQALLQAKGIEATQALINAGSSYQLDTIPVVSMVNHVINYIPSMDLFLDSTSDSTPLGMLPEGDQSKPVLLVQNYREGSKTPTVKPGTNTQKIHTEITIHADGSAHAETRIDLTGELAANYRRYFRNASKDYEDDIVKNYLKRIGLEGSGTFTKDDPKALTDTYHYGANMDISNLVFLPSTGGFRVEPLMFNPMPLVSWSSAAFADLSELTELECSNVTTEETYVYHLPDGMKIIATPDDSNISNNRVSFTSTHKLDGNTLTVFQKLDDRTPGAVCPVAMAEEDKAFAKKTLPTLKSQIIFKM
ncbi:MAG TPA: transglutaminase domain-containing protein, partial [Pseudomonadales bacterium]|nr:transglutaminase domain-containing protein [Pseudomonadales bacterium]